MAYTVLIIVYSLLVYKLPLIGTAIDVTMKQKAIGFNF